MHAVWPLDGNRRVTKADVIQLVCDRLRQVGNNAEFSIVEDSMRQEDTWPYIPVIATQSGKEVTHQIYVGVYANIEAQYE